MDFIELEKELDGSLQLGDVDGSSLSFVSNELCHRKMKLETFSNLLLLG